MNHAELSDSVAASLGVSKVDAKKAVDAVFAAITDRPAARHPQTVDTSTGHIGFRCIVRF